MEIKRIILATALVLTVAAVMFGCSPNGEGETNDGNEASLQFTAEEYPVVDGSTATIPLSEQFAAAVMGMDIEEARQYIQHNKTHAAYENLIRGDADIIFVTSPSEEELALAESSGVELEVVPVVSEGFVFLVSKDNPVDGLTFQEIKDIYAGKITNWKQVGGSDKRIIPYQRPENSGSQTGMLDLVISREELLEPPIEQVIGEMGTLIDSVAVYSNEEDAIGYSYYYFVTDMWGDEEVKLLKVDGVYPNKSSISAGEYPIATAYYAVLRTDTPADSNARALLDWILSEEGQAAAEETGYVPLSR